MTAQHHKPVPLCDIPISIDIDGVTVRGEIMFLYENDITVVITSPVTGLSSGLHVPYFAMGVRRVANAVNGRTIGTTAYGQQQAELLLARCYEYWQGQHRGWGVRGLTAEGWIALPTE